ncbi:transglutaminase domain-containing protein [Polynucleobacter necessarius]|uniref:transglutaminase domain-containing protein n=1 Tax=Polynucleobacter necessarius TaxID=576610 RepID=UPI001E63CF61|nr:transglutaminase domain-containing protein [Polynucleobacter necessarius]
MLETNNLGGKCADINAVFVALARSAGIPARDVYGIRIADSARGYKSLGKGGALPRRSIAVLSSMLPDTAGFQ